MSVGLSKHDMPSSILNPLCWQPVYQVTIRWFNLNNSGMFQEDKKDAVLYPTIDGLSYDR